MLDICALEGQPAAAGVLLASGMKPRRTNSPTVLDCQHHQAGGAARLAACGNVGRMNACESYQTAALMSTGSTSESLLGSCGMCCILCAACADIAVGVCLPCCAVQDGAPVAGHVNKLKALTTAREVAGAMEYLHSQNVLHGDLNGNNILLAGAHITPGTPDQRGFTAKVADFGLSRLLSPGECWSIAD